MRAQQFIVGVDNTPVWLREQIQLGRAKAQYEEDSRTVKEVEIYTASKTYRATKGDVVLMLSTGMTVIPRAIAKKYGEQPVKQSM